MILIHQENNYQINQHYFYYALLKVLILWLPSYSDRDTVVIIHEW